MKRMRKEDLKEAWELLDGKCWFCGQKLHPFANWGATLHTNEKPIAECSVCKKMRRGRSVENFRQDSTQSATRAGAVLEWMASRRADASIKAKLRHAIDAIWGDYNYDFPFFGEHQLEETVDEGSDGSADESSD